MGDLQDEVHPERLQSATRQRRVTDVKPSRHGVKVCHQDIDTIVVSIHKGRVDSTHVATRFALTSY